MNDVTYEAIRELVTARSVRSVARLTPETRLLHDLGIDADDAFELFLVFAKRFGVDLSAMHWPDYFGHEGDALGRAISRFAGGAAAVDKLPVTLHDLAEAAAAKRWVKQRPRPNQAMQPTAGRSEAAS